MNNETEFICRACDSKVIHDTTKGHVPKGWCMRKIEGTVYLLCQSCDQGLGVYASDLSPVLCEAFKKKGIILEGCKKWG